MQPSRRTILLTGVSAVGATLGSRALPASAHEAPYQRGSVTPYPRLDGEARGLLQRVAHDSWKFFGDDVDPTTHLPYDNVTYAGGSERPTSVGRYTSAANIGVYLWSVVAARDLGVISDAEAAGRARNLLSSVKRLNRYRGFLYQWYDTSTGSVLLNPGQGDVAHPGGTFDNGSFLSCVDNGWYVSGLIVSRQAIPQVRGLVSELMREVDFSIFYDDRPETQCNVNPAVPGNQPTGQMYGGYYVGKPPTEGDNWQHYYHSGALYSDPRISAYIGMGLRQMPGNVWWRSWRMLPPPAPFPQCSTDPDFSWQGQWPLPDTWVTVKDPVSGGTFPVFESHYTYPGSDLTFIPTWGGGMFEALMANVVVPETSWGPHSFGLANQRTVEVHRKYTAEQLKLPVWGMSPSSTPDDSGGYSTYGVEGLTFPYYGGGATAAHPNLGLSQCHACATEDVVTPHASFIALDPAPEAAVANIQELLRRFPGVYGSHGFFDAVNPTTGSVGHRILVLDQSMIMASLANALNNRSMQRYFATDSVSWAARAVLGYERMSI
ncbi:MAG TPA: glucoamylase family protein [Propionibacteriaceae bacterium]|nr:glucoamylase family protein [Propionibacteriaceae bacterium]